MGQFKVVVPEAMTNLITNPSIELATTGWTAVGGTVARSSTRQRRGLYSLAVDPTTATTDGCYFTVALISGTTYTFSVDVWGVNTVPYRIYFADTSATVKGTPTTFTGNAAWQRVEVTWTADATADFRVYVVKNNSTNGTVFYVDGAQVEAKAYSTTYCDGEQPGCSWTGIQHASTSTRSVTSRAGGRVRDLDDDLSFVVTAMQGVGMPAIQNQDTEYALLPGAIHEGAKVRQATVLLSGTIKGTSLADLHTKRRVLVDAFKPNLKTKEPVLLQYTGSGTTLELPVHYEAGLTLQKKSGFVEEVALQLAAPDPFWRAETDTVVVLDGYVTFTANYAAMRDNGLWSDWGGGVAGGTPFIYAIAVAPDGSVYAGGIFTTAGGVTVNYVAKWDGSVWSALGTGMDGAVHALAVAADGTLYAGGDFTTAGGGAAAKIAKWNGSAWSALSSGMNGGVYALAAAPDGTLYAVGSFTTAGGGAANRIAKWNGSAWSALGTGMDDATIALAIAPDGSVYAGGYFTTAGGGSAIRIAKWNGTAWSALGSGMNGTVYVLAMGGDGMLYAGGAFTTAGGVSCAKIARWNGSAWSALGSGMDDSVTTLAYIDGELWAGGVFTIAGGNALADRMARWNGTGWSQTDVDLPGTATVYALAADVARGRVFVGFNTTGTAKRSAYNLTVNAGSVDAYPRIIIKRSGGTSATMKALRNYAQSGTEYALVDELLLDYALANGEEITIDLTPGAKKITSSSRGNVLGAILPGSGLATFSLAPGSNDLYLYVLEVGSPTVTAFARYRARYWGVDA